MTCSNSNPSRLHRQSSARSSGGRLGSHPPLDNDHITGRFYPSFDNPSKARAGLTVGPGGVRCSVQRENRAMTGGGRRGSISSFSPSSRRRLQALLARVDWSIFPSYFVGLTYHDDYEPGYEYHSRHMAALRRRILRHYGSAVVAILWRREYKIRQRGACEGEYAPHFHLLIMFRVDLPDLQVRLDLLRMWMGVIGGTGAQWAHGCHVQRTRNTRGRSIGKLLTYLSKYLAKVQERVCDTNTGEVIDTGRMWGVWGDLPMATIVVKMSGDDLVVYLRRLRRWSQNGYAQRLSARWRGWLLLEDGWASLQLLQGLGSVDLIRIWPRVASVPAGAR